MLRSTRPVLRAVAAAALFALAWPGAGPLAGQGPQTVAHTAAPERMAAPSRPSDALGRDILARANAHQGTKILVSTEDRWLWLVSAKGDTLMSVSVAIGMQSGFEYEGRDYFFETPRGVRRVLGKEPNPVWTVPEWHYIERAMANGYELVRLTKDTKHLLDDGSFIMTIGEDVGRLNQYGNFYRFPPGSEIMFDGKVFVPPFGTNQRRVPDALGPYKLDTGNGYLLHGTHIYNEDSIGDAVSHGCVRLSNDDVTQLYGLTPVGTSVFIF
ncbi:MAG TPA: L,D-transpeptidase [Longimicrobiales bacterium]|nr:L,D-transpeptidase [Longimicrobiales bacterium]